jgi:hypothetical protein
MVQLGTEQCAPREGGAVWAHLPGRQRMTCRRHQHERNLNRLNAARVFHGAHIAAVRDLLRHRSPRGNAVAQVLSSCVTSPARIHPPRRITHHLRR